MGILNTWGFSNGSGVKGLRRDPGGGTADGGRCTPIDYMFDNDGPLHTETAEASAQRRAMMEDRDRHSRAEKMFRVTENARRGGSGLWHEGK